MAPSIIRYATIEQTAAEMADQKRKLENERKKDLANWVANMRHTLVVYDTRSNQGLVCYGFNEVTSSQ